jgi:methyl-accepting chemotaxis protein
VVAAEVRALAQRSAAAAKEIAGLIQSSVKKVDAGGALVDQAGQTMQEIVSSVKHVADIMIEISAASDEQSEGIRQINQAVEQIDDMTQQNSALVEQAAAAAQQMHDRSLALGRAVSIFKTQGAGSPDDARTWRGGLGIVRRACRGAIGVDAGGQEVAGGKVDCRFNRAQSGSPCRGNWGLKSGFLD